MKMCWHFGQRTCLPAALGGSCSVVVHDGQGTVLMDVSKCRRSAPGRSRSNLSGVRGFDNRSAARPTLSLKLPDRNCRYIRQVPLSFPADRVPYERDSDIAV